LVWEDSAVAEQSELSAALLDLYNEESLQGFVAPWTPNRFIVRSCPGEAQFTVQVNRERASGAGRAAPCPFCNRSSKQSSRRVRAAARDYLALVNPRPFMDSHITFALDNAGMGCPEPQGVSGKTAEQRAALVADFLSISTQLAPCGWTIVCNAHGSQSQHLHFQVFKLDTSHPGFAIEKASKSRYPVEVHKFCAGGAAVPLVAILDKIDGWCCDAGSDAAVNVMTHRGWHYVVLRHRSRITTSNLTREPYRLESLELLGEFIVPAEQSDITHESLFDALHESQ
jgi:hypothetical protein